MCAPCALWTQGPTRKRRPPPVVQEATIAPPTTEVQGCRLRTLRLPGNHLNAAQLRAIASMHMPHLTHLDLADNALGADAAARRVAHSARTAWLAWLPGLTALREISLARNGINADDALRVLRALCGLRYLETVDLAHNPIYALPERCLLRDAVAELCGGACACGVGHARHGTQRVGTAAAAAATMGGNCGEVQGGVACGACADGMSEICSEVEVVAPVAVWEDMSWLW